MTIVKTLDAIHRASAILIRERRGIELLFSTHDAQQAIAARALNFTTLESEAAREHAPAARVQDICARALPNEDCWTMIPRTLPGDSALFVTIQGPSR